MLNDVENGNLPILPVFELLSYSLRHERPQAVNVDDGTEVLLPRQVKVAHAHLAKVPRMAGRKGGGGECKGKSHLRQKKCISATHERTAKLK